MVTQADGRMRRRTATCDSLGAVIAKTRMWEWATLPARWLRWRSRGWSTDDDRAFHDELFQADGYDPFSPSYPGNITIRRFADHAARYVRDVTTVVDLGCGPGEITCELARRFPAVRFTGIDHSEVALARGRAHAARLGLTNLAFAQGDLEHYTPAPGTDLVMMLDAFHHVLDPAGFVARVGAVCPRLFLIEPAGEWTGRWDRRGDLDWLPATLFQIRDRLDAQFGLAPPITAAPTAGPRAPAAGDPTEHRYTLADFQGFFAGFGVELRGTIAGLELYGGRPGDQHALRAAFGDLTYDLLVRLEDVLFAQGVDLAAKHWALYAERGGRGTWPEARLRRATVQPQPAAGLLPAYALDSRDLTVPSRVAPGATFDAQVTLVNRGWQTWDSRQAVPVLASYHWLDGQGHTAIHDGMRTPLPAPVPQGQEARVTVQVQAPAAPGRYQLVLDLVHEGTTWFSEQGCAIPPAAIDVA
jgi:SAM-dependent methyltransferase